jgi:hypothetical protein
MDDWDFGRDTDPDPDTTRSQCRDEPTCWSCGSRYNRVVRRGMCEECADVADDARCDDLQRRTP